MLDVVCFIVILLYSLCPPVIIERKLNFCCSLKKIDAPSIIGINFVSQVRDALVNRTGFLCDQRLYCAGCSIALTVNDVIHIRAGDFRLDLVSHDIKP